ncbi:MAG: cation:proton antiporter [Verrucomicrobia bacterium]|nr:cation:proton antiporter [Verrucomicrobiota bacterium]
MTYLPALPMDITPLMSFGIMLVIGSLGGFMAHKIRWFPSITGFLIVGVLFGPSCVGFLSHETIAESQTFIDVALTLILYRLGLSLDLKTILASPKLLITSLTESLLTFSLAVFVLYLFHIPAAVSALVAAVVVSSSPAVLLHIAHEVHAKGIVTESAKTLVALNNLISFILFSVTLSSLHLASGSGWVTVILQPLYQFSGSFLLGILFGRVMHGLATKTAQATQYHLAIVIGTLMLSAAISKELNFSTIFTALVVGVVVKTREQERLISNMEFGPAFELFFIVLFVFAGASLHLKELIAFAPAVLALAGVRCVAKIVGTVGTAAVFKAPIKPAVASGLLLIPMAGLAIGLVQVTNELFPQHAPVISAIVFGSVTVFETIGPPVAAFAFRYAGESPSAAQD